MAQRLQLIFLLASYLFFSAGVLSISILTIENKCNQTVWPVIFSWKSQLTTTGFTLRSGEARALQAPSSWYGLISGRTLCSNDSTGNFTCATGDCESKTIECHGSYGWSMVTYVYFRIDYGGTNSHIISLEHGYNLPVMVAPSQNSPTCFSSGCMSYLLFLAGGTAAVALIIIIVAIVVVMRAKNARRKRYSTDENIEAAIMLKRYSYENVKNMTNSFAHVLGKGGFGTVYKGKLPDAGGRDIALKILDDSKGNGDDFINELASMKSIVSLLDARGTIGYIAPEVFSKNFGEASHKSDVYSYGMVVLEMIGAKNKRRAETSRSNPSSMNFPEWIYDDLERKETIRLVGDHIMEDEEEKIVKKMALVGLWCIQTNPTDRPPIRKVIGMLEGSLEALQVPPKPLFDSHLVAAWETIKDSKDTSSISTQSLLERKTLRAGQDTLIVSREEV
ncbi:hypothetical protein Bca52824_089009 [Brassica carinata]|uniref:Serine-threonine/tyrosine-protein kinase catalytic domain-containing protein n=1 Tax=Brassica carinata TaxID=52824 RepID=A0A8X7TRC8_BRACI|nr:hypothetical protein Bca52824_089009 [Brassica carinata]